MSETDEQIWDRWVAESRAPIYHHWPGHAEDVAHVDFGAYMLAGPYFIVALALLFLMPPAGLVMILFWWIGKKAREATWNK